MKKPQIQRFVQYLLAGPVVGFFLSCSFLTLATAGEDLHYIYTIDNSTADNRVLVLEQKPDGSLVTIRSLSTHGVGTGAGLGSQGALAVSNGGRWLFAVSAGSNQITTFAVDDGNLRFVSTTSSGGIFPISLTSHGNLVYVLNAGGAGNITGFEIQRNGSLEPIADSKQDLGGGSTGPAEIKFSNGGDFLIVSEKNVNLLAVYEVEDGVAHAPTFTSSSGPVPFGFDIDPRDHVIVSEAANGTVSSYDLRDHTHDLSVITGSLQTEQKAPCWLIVTPNGRYAYTGNTASGTVTGFSVARNGVLTRLVASGVNASTGAGSHLIDVAASADGRFLYALANISQTISAFRIAADGSLTPSGIISGVPTSTSGLIAR